MTLLVPNEGEVEALSRWLNKSSTSDLVLRLYGGGSGNLTPAETDVYSTYSAVEATWTGYASITLTGASWTIVGGAPTSATYAQQTFTNTNNITTWQGYGYYVTSSTTLHWAERFSDGPYAVANASDPVKITPVITQE